MHGGRKGAEQDARGTRGGAGLRGAGLPLSLVFMSALLESNSVSNMEITHTRGEHPF